LCLAVVVVTIAAARRLLGMPDADVPSGPRLPADLAVRMATALLGVGAITAVASALGPQLSGLLASFPLIASIMSAFIHAADGATAARAFAIGVLRGLPSIGAFAFVLGSWLGELGTAAAFILATG